MARYYTEDDVARWEEANAGSIRLHIEKLKTESAPNKVDFHLGMLHLAYESRAMTSIARGRYADAIESLRASASTLCRQFEIGTRQIDAGDYQALLAALVTKDAGLVSRFATLFRPTTGIPSSCFLARVLLTLLSDLDAAKKSLAEKRPRFESECVGVVECFEAIANKNEAAFTSALKIATKSWSKCAARRDRGLPFAVCHLRGVGLVRLAEPLFGHRIAISDEHIPSQLLD